MRFSYIVLLLIIILILPASILQAADQPSYGPNAQLAQGKTLFFSARRLFISMEGTPAEVKSLLNASKKVFSSLENDYDRSLWLGQVEYLNATIAGVNKDDKQSVINLNDCVTLSKAALKFNSNSSDARHLLADCYMKLTTYNGLGYTLMHVPSALKLLNESLDIDSTNYSVYNSLAVYYVNAPGIVGGGNEKGIEAFRRALSSRDEFDNFMSYVWMGAVYGIMDKRAEGLNSLQKALAIYPNNTWAKTLYNEVNTNSLKGKNLSDIRRELLGS